ncbi:hypothetical protein [Glycomyces terrestris]|uniref:Uncharacterized protein n=1 Tax=Glycomyces terrestris TaxID=2493553 RepID=A0A426UVJ3_9ACTN|nr:hypothetical protein [Glycomyces terrestris]RRR98365.1 hypothetical protein EIW28_15815 [Glycomyces terrestris]
MTPAPGQVYRRAERQDALVVVLSSREDNLRTGWVTVCAYNLTDQVGNLPSAQLLHSIVPAPGYVTWTLHQSVPASYLKDPVGEVETAAIAAARLAMEARFAA